MILTLVQVCEYALDRLTDRLTRGINIQRVDSLDELAQLLNCKYVYYRLRGDVVEILPTSRGLEVYRQMKGPDVECEDYEEEFLEDYDDEDILILE